MNPCGGGMDFVGGPENFVEASQVIAKVTFSL